MGAGYKPFFIIIIMLLYYLFYLEKAPMIEALCDSRLAFFKREDTRLA